MSLEDEVIEHPFEEPAPRRRVGCVTPLGILIVFGVLCVGLAVGMVSYMRRLQYVRLITCNQSLGDTATALEMYSTDWSGHYPASLDLLTPNYLKTIPECSATGRVTYKLITGKNVGYNTVDGGLDDYYLIYCDGENHTGVGVPANYPQYDGIWGLVER